MRVNLSISGFIPSNSPYASAPAESQNITTEIVDWILIELRQTLNGPVISQQSALLRKDGYLVGLDGVSTEIPLNELTSGNYYIVIRHRNHTAFMSSASVEFSQDSVTIYNFSSDAAQIYGTNGGKQISPGIWGMWAGDINQDGSVNNLDYTTWRGSAQNGGKGYNPADFNGDGQITTADYYRWYNNNREGAVSRVPPIIP